LEPQAGQVSKLQGLQAAVLQSQVQQNVPCLNAEVDKMGPADVVKASRAINAAYALQTAELVGIPPLAIPYQAAGFEALAKELIAITRAEPTTADPDREIVDGWAEKLVSLAGTSGRRPDGEHSLHHRRGHL
jgi:hypothetical protein